MGIKPETVARVQRFAFAVIRNNYGRAIPEELETNAFSKSVVRNALAILQKNKTIFPLVQGSLAAEGAGLANSTARSFDSSLANSCLGFVF